MVTGILQRPGVSAESFQAKLLEISDMMQGMFYDTGYDREAARKNSTRALTLWMDLYLKYYLKPPESFRNHPRWREVMDSVTGPLRRIQTYAREDDFIRGHHQLRVLQDSLTEFYGEPALRKAVDLGPIFHTLETLQYIAGEGSSAARERRARLRLLRDRFHRWMTRWNDQEAARRAFQPFIKGLAGLEAAVRAERAEEVPQRSQALLGATRSLVSQALALEWKLSTVKPQHSDPEVH
jgi:hypothetical protein